MTDLRIRPLLPEDTQTVFRWRNEPYIVNLGTLKKTVTWDEHLNWFNDTLKGIHRKAFILEIDKIPAGQVRFDIENENSCYISVYLIREFSGKGHGINFIKLGCQRIFAEWLRMQAIYALVRRDNFTGQKAFLKAGFIQEYSFEDADHFSYVFNRK